MRIVSCFVENFGGIHQRLFEFDSNVSVIEQANGTGKTTLATFLRCMLYGMPRRSRDLGKDLRRRYEPWQGGRYGGYAIIEVRGERYRVERSFGAAPKDDSVIVYDLKTGKPTDKFGADLGISLFGLDAESFERSAYVPQERMAGSLLTTGIQAKLAALVDATDKASAFDDALKKLHDARSARYSFRGNTGAYYQLGEDITRLNDQLTQLDTISGEITRVSDRVQRLQNTLDQQRFEAHQLRQELARGAGMQDQRARAQCYRALSEANAAAQSAYAQVAEGFSKQVPSEEELRCALDQAQTLEFAAQAQAFEAAHQQELPGRGSDAEKQAAQAADACASACGSKESSARKNGCVALIALGVLLAGAGVAFMLGSLLDLLVLFAYQDAVGVGAFTIGLVAALSGCAQLPRGKKRAFGAHAADAVSPMQEVDSSARAQDSLADHLSEQAAQASCYLDEFAERFAINREQRDRSGLMDIWEQTNKLRACAHACERAQAELDCYKAENGEALWTMADEELLARLDMASLQSDEERIARSLEANIQLLAKDEARLQMLKQKQEDLPALQQRLADCIKRQREVREEAQTIDKTMAFLQQAKEARSAQCSAPVQQAFARYLAVLLGEEAAKAQIDSDFRVSFDQQGALRSSDYLSMGYADLVMVCMRMALVDVLFAKEDPFVVFDDPFVNLDDDLMEKAFDLLDRLSQDRQIIYFTCSSSRRP